MKLTHRHRLSVALMLLSILVLVLFQGFWLLKVYNEQYDFLQQSTTNTFRNTVFALQDSLIEYKLLPLKKSFVRRPQKATLNVVGYGRKDSTSFIKSRSANPLRNTIVIRRDSLPNNVVYRSITTTKDSTYAKTFMQGTPRAMSIFIRRGDSTFRKRLDTLNPKDIKSVHISDSQIQIVVNASKKDTNVSQVLRPILTRMPMMPPQDDKHKEGKSTVVVRYDGHQKTPFTFRLESDSLRIKDLNNAFQKNLTKENIPVRFVIQRIGRKNNFNDVQQVMATEIVPAMIPDTFYQATFGEYQPYLFKKIAPHVLFSLFLIALTGFSFWLIYQNLRQQQRLTQLKNDFISNITHELKTPITTVGVAIEALSNFNVLHNPNQTKEYLNISKNELNRLSMLVDKVLKMAIFEQQTPDLRLETIDLAELTSQILDSMKLQFDRSKAKVDFECTGTLFTIHADRIHLTNVVYNLLENALKYSPQQPEIEVNLSQTDEWVKLTVADNGVGIPAAYQKKIFEKFFRVPTGDVHNVKGHGLGLSYVESIVNQHGGTINVHSEEGKGSEFVVLLPLVKEVS